MGNAEEPLPEPDQYLKKYSRVESKKSTGLKIIVISYISCMY